jgi:hypothetical protein
MGDTIELIRGGNVLDISDGVNYKHLNNDGFGMSPLHRITERGPMQHGDTDRDYRLDPRQVQLITLIMGTSEADYYDKREELLRYLSPLAVTKLRVTQGDGTIRQLDTYCVSGPYYSTRDAFRSQYHRAGFTLKANDPTWYDPAGAGVTFDLGGGDGSGLHIPFEIPFEVGTATLDVDKTIDYPGTWHSFPHLIRITGPITNPVITNVTTDEVIDFTGITIAAGDYYDLDLRYGYKTAVDDTGASVLDELTADSDLATWHIEAASNASTSKINVINVSGTVVTSATSVAISYFVRYLGI